MYPMLASACQRNQWSASGEGGGGASCRRALSGCRSCTSGLVGGLSTSACLREEEEKWEGEAANDFSLPASGGWGEGRRKYLL